MNWLTMMAKRIANCSEFEAIDISLTLAQLSKENRVFGAANLARAILMRLDSIPPLAHASAWALRCFVGERHRWHRIWRPNAVDIRYISKFIEDSNNDSTAIAYLIILLGKENYVYGIDMLLQRLLDPNDNIRRAAAKALGEIKQKVALKPLIISLRDIDAGVRRNAANALGKIQDVEATNSLIELLQDPDVSVRRIAARAFRPNEGQEGSR